MSDRVNGQTMMTIAPAEHDLAMAGSGGGLLLVCQHMLISSTFATDDQGGPGPDHSMDHRGLEIDARLRGVYIGRGGGWGRARGTGTWVATDDGRLEQVL